jgi:RND family efflux transporter MFP subunit
MKRLIWSMSFVLAIALAACGSPTPAAISPSNTAPAAETSDTSSLDVVVASAVVSPVQTARLGFTISALIKEVTVKEGDAVQAGQSLIVLDTPDLEYAVTAAEAAFQAASLNAELQDADRVRLFNERTGHFYYVSLPHEVQDIAEAKAAKAQAVLDAAQAALAQGMLTAPFDGMVVSIQAIPGELVLPDQAVLTLAMLDDMQVETTDLSERDIARVKIGQPVSIYIEALDVTVGGKVIRISPISKTVGGDVVFPVTIKLNEQPDGLLWGMTAEVEIKIK